MCRCPVEVCFSGPKFSIRSQLCKETENQKMEALFLTSTRSCLCLCVSSLELVSCLECKRSENADSWFKPCIPAPSNISELINGSHIENLKFLITTLKNKEQVKLNLILCASQYIQIIMSSCNRQ